MVAPRLAPGDMSTELRFLPQQKGLVAVSVHVLQVDRADEAETPLLGFHIDQPVPGESVGGYPFVVRGWVLGKEHRIRSVELIHGDDVVASVPIADNRPDVHKAYPSSEQSSHCGFTLSAGLLGLPSECSLLVRATLETGRLASIVQITVRRRLISSGFCVPPSPLLVTSLGRTGTTYLMRLLLSHPQLVGTDRYPYETRLAGYWAHALKVLTDPADHRRSAHPDSFQYDPFWVGRNPYYAPTQAATPWLSSTHMERVILFTQETIHKFYADLARDCGRPDAKYFVEKCNPGLIPQLMRELFPATVEVFLVRDFRDMLASILAFNARRGYPAFGRGEAANDGEWIAGLGKSARHLHHDWVARRESSLLIRYEDLVTKPTETLTRLLEHSTMDSTNATVASLMEQANQDTADFRAHRTSENPTASIGRWKLELDQATLKVCDEAFGGVLEGFGYN